VPTPLSDREDVVDGLRIFARVPRSQRIEPSPTVILIHGLSISSRYERPCLRRLAASCRVYAPDLPGYGCSDDPPDTLSIGDLAGTLGRWLDVVGLDHVALVGDSLGAHVAASLARQRADTISHLVLSGLSLDSTGRRRITQVLRATRDIPREPVSLLPLHVRDAFNAGPGRVLRTLDSAIADPFYDRLDELTMPTLVVRGEHDPLAPPEWPRSVAARLPRGSFVEVPGAPHAVNYARPDAYAALILDWITTPG